MQREEELMPEEQGVLVNNTHELIILIRNLTGRALLGDTQV